MTGTTDNGILTLNGTSPNVSVEQNLTFDGTKLTISGYQAIESATAGSVPSGTTTIFTLANSSGCAGYFDYCVKDLSSPFGMRSGTLMVVWDNVGATYVDFSTPDLNGPTVPIQLTATNTGSDIQIDAVVTSSTWDVKISARIIY
jgi:hypothetical protein